jgi:type I restriction enzyme S subunit
MIRSNGSVRLVGQTLPVTEAAVGMAYAGYLMRLRTDEEALDPAFLAVALASPAAPSDRDAGAFHKWGQQHQHR